MAVDSVNAKGKIIYSTGAPKSTDGGMDLGRDATNSLGKISKTKENSPSASSMASGKGK